MLLHDSQSALHAFDNNVNFEFNDPTRLLLFVI